MYISVIRKRKILIYYCILTIEVYTFKSTSRNCFADIAENYVIADVDNFSKYISPHIKSLIFLHGISDISVERFS